jgi:hypothetical protein
MRSLLPLDPVRAIPRAHGARWSQAAKFILRAGSSGLPRLE